ELRFREQCMALIKEEGPSLFADYLAREKANTGLVQSIKKIIDWLLGQQQKRWIYATAAVGTLILILLFGYKKLLVPIEEQQQIAVRDSASINEQKIDTSQTTEPAVLPNAPDQKSATEDKQQAEPEAELSQVYAMNFQPMPYLEAMIDDVTRSFSLTVLSPKINEKLSGHILFQWQIDGATVASLKILNNRGEEIFAIKPEQNQLIFKEKLAPGLYYWKLESEEEVVYVGKFLVGEGNKGIKE
ncbi:MAG: hypothetical protein ONB27_12450, partial [candidate division KSB1 bacterium]|nr:hypothetical protein [candidate division KSB1 bacterium]